MILKDRCAEQILYVLSSRPVSQLVEFVAPNPTASTAPQVPISDSRPDRPGSDQCSQDRADQLQVLENVHPAMIRGH